MALLLLRKISSLSIFVGTFDWSENFRQILLRRPLQFLALYFCIRKLVKLQGALFISSADVLKVDFFSSFSREIVKATQFKVIV